MEKEKDTKKVSAEKIEAKDGNQKNAFVEKVDKFFEITTRGSTIRTEIIAGLTTFFAMCYILLVNPDQMTGFTRFEFGGFAPEVMTVYYAIFIATAIGAIVGTLLMAFYAKMPFAQAPGMGLNSFFATAFIFGSFTGLAFTASNIPEMYFAGLSIILVSGVLFFIFSITGLRKIIIKGMPDALKRAIPAGIGLFIAYIAFQNAGIIQSNPFVQVQFVDLTAGWYTIAGPIAALIGFLMIAALSKTKVKGGSIIIGIIATTALYYLFNIGNAAAFTAFTEPLINPFTAFRNFGEVGFLGAFKGFKYWTAENMFLAIMLVITFCLVDMFDTLGTLQGTCAEANMLDENGIPKEVDKCMMADSVATVTGGLVGTSTVTTYVESASGVSAGGRTGLTSVVVAGLFFIAMFLSPLAIIIPGVATAPALMFVGVLMLKNIKEVDFTDITNAVPAFMTLIMMPLTYSISNGIALGMISYVILRLASIRSMADVKAFFKKDSVVLVLSILFMLRFFLVKM